MSITFNIDEILEIAEQIERNGANFYRAAKQKFDDPDIHTVLETLAAMEDDHEITFRELRKTLSAKERTAHVFDPDNETSQYLKALADHLVFSQNVTPAELLSDIETPIEVLRTAIGLEEDSIAFYLGIREMVAPHLGQDKVQAIVKEEMGHITLLSRQIRALQA